MFSKRVKDLVQGYIDEAIIQYGKLETMRHKAHIFIEPETGKKYAGFSEVAINKALRKINETLELADENALLIASKEILKRSNITKKQIAELDEEEKYILTYEILKAETNVLFYDNLRNNARKEEAKNYPITQEYVSIAHPTPQTHSQPVANENLVPSTFYAKTAREFLDEFIKLKCIKNSESFRNKRDVEIFLDIVGKKYLCDITPDDFTRLVSDIRLLPPATDYRQLYKELTANQVIARSKKENLPIISSKTLSIKLTNINSFLDYAVAEKLIDANRLKAKAKLTTPKSPKRSEKRKEFRNEQLEKLFNESSAYTTKFEENLKKFPSRVWIPLILLYQGFRINEIAQVYLNQIIVLDGINTFKISEDLDDQSLKNQSSKRKVAIHPRLIELGFFKFIEQQRAKGCERLFQELYYTDKKGYGQAFSKIFNAKKFKEEWLEKETLEKIQNKKLLLDLHSFRHNFSTSLKGIVESEVLDEAMGHETKKDYKYGKVRPKVMLDGISKCHYDIDISKLEKKLKEYYKA